MIMFLCGLAISSDEQRFLWCFTFYSCCLMFTCFDERNVSIKLKAVIFVNFIVLFGYLNLKYKIAENTVLLIQVFHKLV